MLAEIRHERIRRLIDNKNYASVVELCGALDVSDATVRRDLRLLEKEGFVRRTHGGAVRVEQGDTGHAPLFFGASVEDENYGKKISIAKRAYEIIEDYETVILDSATTVTSMCNFIKEGGKKGLTVVTNSPKAVVELLNCPHVTIIMIGGQVRKSIASCIGALAHGMLKNVRADKAFIGINGVDLESDVITTPNMFESDVKRAMMNSAKQSYILADSTKFGKTFLSRVCNAAEVDGIVTDSGVPGREIKLAEDKGIDLVAAPEFELNSDIV